MEIISDIEYSFTAGFDTYRVGDYVKVKTNFLERYGEITKISSNNFEIKVHGDDERFITIKFCSLRDICHINRNVKYLSIGSCSNGYPIRISIKLADGQGKIYIRYLNN